MKTLYLDCAMGAAGDMLMAALLDLLPNRAERIQTLNTALAGLAEIRMEEVQRCGICARHVRVFVHGQEEDEHLHEHEHTHSHPHSHLNDLKAKIRALELPLRVREDAEKVYALLAQAESEVHGRPVEEIHFHEVGSMDAMADVVGVCFLMHELSPEKVMASPVNVGSGTVQCAHGILPVPAPATERLLRGVPVYSGKVKAELCTPTGAALLRYFVNSFEEMPVMRVNSVGYGAGTKDFPQANVLRTLWGETEETHEYITELACNLDDMTSEELAFAAEELMRSGALDVSVQSLQMKKNRPGFLLTCMCREGERDRLLRCIFANTTTLGVREYRCKRYNLKRSVREMETEYGTMRVKCAEGYGVKREKTEYDDLARAAREQGVSLLSLRGVGKEM